jgi:hypothetical protein
MVGDAHTHTHTHTHTHKDIHMHTRTHTHAHIGYCKQCNHEAILHEYYNGMCLPCARWDEATIQQHHTAQGNGMTQVQQGMVCPYCSLT